MLQLKGIKKNYYVASETVEALKGVDIKFRKSEFVSILGPSGCGKTTLLNIIGGLDRYTDGDLIIRGKSTKYFKDHDWDSYRNHTIGFVFQSYNLIPHQTVLENVELALTLSGVSKSERRKRAIDALTEVGLADKINNKPNQLSGGQMQRVAIARALVNNPDILLADEPTGALDTKTSKQIMDILKSISKNKLIIMVTHNPSIALEYSNRIIKLVDGIIIDDSNPYEGEEEKKEVIESVKKKDKTKKTSMSFWTALSLSFKNLLTKKARTFMVAFAGSIGIIGIALILSVSNGFQLYIDKVQEDTLSTYPISITKQTVDYSSILTELNSAANEKIEIQDGIITSNDTMIKMIEMTKKLQESAIVENNLVAFKKYIEENEQLFDENSSAIQYEYNIKLNVYKPDGYQVNPSNVFQLMLGDQYQMYESMGYASMLGGFNVWDEMIDNNELLQTQYDLLGGKWPTEHNQLVIVVDSNNQISDYVLYSLGLKDPKELEDLYDRFMGGEEIVSQQVSFKYEDLLNLKYHLVMPSQYYEKNENLDKWEKVGNTEEDIKKLISEGIELEIVGILRPKESASATSINGSIGYLSSLVREYSKYIESSKIYMEQVGNPSINVFTGEQFVTTEITVELLEQIMTRPILEAFIKGYFSEQLSKEIIDALNQGVVHEKLLEVVEKELATNDTYEGNLSKIGYVDYDSPNAINIYPKDFESKDTISQIISDYNADVSKAGKSEDTISYTDYIGIFLSSITTIINVITYVLIAFVAISLVVSSIMIGVITYISVLERTKEIGILRSIGARKKDISRVFTAETVVIGFTAGTIGILVTLLLTIPINLIINHLAKFALNAAQLPFVGAIILIAISVILTVIAGLFPSKVASNRDPVEALRTE